MGKYRPVILEKSRKEREGICIVCKKVVNDKTSAQVVCSGTNVLCSYFF